jgi:ABC-2 type transport system ATP-binding protein
MSAIRCQNLSRSFGRVRAVNDLSIEIPSGSFFALLGPNGAGKSTMLKMLMGLTPPTGGEAFVLGANCTALKRRDLEKIGYVADGQDLPEWMKVSQLLDYCRPMYPTWDDALVKRLLDLFDLPLDRKLKALSRGMRMKAALLSNLAYRPELVIMDEPFSGLDPLSRDDFIQGILELPDDDRPSTFVVSSHDIEEVDRLADDVAFLTEGDLLVRESADSLRRRFRRIQVTWPLVASAEIDSNWMQVSRSETLLQFVHEKFLGEETAAELNLRFPGSTVTDSGMNLREIFVALARRSRGKTKGGES